MSPWCVDQTTGADPVTLARLVRGHAAGLVTEIAAVDLLITHRHWLTRPAFTTRFVHPVSTDDGQHIGARIDWPDAVAALDRGELPCSRSQAGMLRIAASLAAGLPVVLHDVLGGLDAANIAALNAAITTANGT